MLASEYVSCGESLADLTVKFSPSNRVAFSVSPIKSSVPAPKSSPRFGKIISAPSRIFPPDSPCSLYLQSLSEVGEFSVFACSLSDRPKSKVSGLHLPRKKSFTRSAKQTLLSAGGALEKEGFKPEDFYFFTGTLPGSTPQAMRELARYSRFALNRLKQSLRDEKIYLTLNCWEWQKRGALHLHLVYVCECPVQGEFLQKKLKENWYDILDDISERSGQNLYRKNGFTSYTRDSLPVQKYGTRIVRCESKPGSSPVAYLAKYLGKGFSSSKSDNETVTESSQVFYPSSWWSISDKVRDLIEKYSCAYIVRLPSSLAFERFLEYSEILVSASKLVLNPWQKPDYPEYVYRDLYLESSAYSDCVDFFRDLFSPLFTGASSLSISSGGASLFRHPFPSLQYLRLSRNHVLRDRFTYQWLPDSFSSLAVSFLYSPKFHPEKLGAIALEQKAFLFLEQFCPEIFGDQPALFSFPDPIAFKDREKHLANRKNPVPNCWYFPEDDENILDEKRNDSSEKSIEDFQREFIYIPATEFYGPPMPAWQLLEPVVAASSSDVPPEPIQLSLF